MRRALFLSVGMLALLFLSGVSSLRADDDTAVSSSPRVSATPVTDPAQVGQHYREVLARPVFDETDDTAVNSRIEDWLSQWFKRLGAKFGEFTYSSHLPAVESLLMTLLVGFSIAVLLYIMVRLTRRRAGMEPELVDGLSVRKTFRPPEFYDEEIRQAVQAGDWHKAWLAAWRQFLSRLEYRNLVEADRTRTNREYLAQLREKSLPASALALLGGMVDAYDRFIYGRREIGESDWTVFRAQINEAALLLHLDDKRSNAEAVTS
jgi:hypothetical protein